MSFQNIATAETPDFYIDVAFKSATTRADLMRKKSFPDKFTKSKEIELEKIRAINKSLDKSLGRILASFPQIDELPEFYRALVKLTTEYDELKNALGAVRWVTEKINDLSGKYTSRIRKCQDMQKMNAYRREYYGRVCSVVKQIKGNLPIIEASRRIMKQFPVVKTGMPTVCICGFPNVGKTTLLFRLTGSKPEISAYAFTTKSLNTAYMQEGVKKLQLIDTPGTLNRFGRMNAIEKQAYLAVKHCADFIVYVFDLTEPYPIEDQLKLLEYLKEFGKEIVLYLSKTDILDRETVQEFEKTHKTVDLEALKVLLLKRAG